jgi:hypothetical protein
MDYLLTWNCKHIANPHTSKKVEALFLEQGIEIPVIYTPFELMGA